MYDYMEEYIAKHNKGEEYTKALENRIALSILGVGINQTHSNDSLIEGSRLIKEMLQCKRYEVALSKLDTSVMPFAWKVFYLFSQTQTFFFTVFNA